MRLRGANFCTSSAGFAPSFVRQPNGPECPQIVRTHENVSLGTHGVPGVFVVKNSDATPSTNFCTSSAHFAPNFVRQPNGPECTQIVGNAPKRQFRVQWSGSGAFVARNFDAPSWHALLH